MKITTTTLCLALALGPGQALAGALCTPATVNPATVIALKPFTPMPAVIEAIGCDPDSIIPTILPGMTPPYQAASEARFIVPVIGGEIDAFFDANSTLSVAIYVDPTHTTFSSGFRQLSPPDPVPWQINQGPVPTIP